MEQFSPDISKCPSTYLVVYKLVLCWFLSMFTRTWSSI